MSKRNIEKHILMNKAEAQDLQKKQSGRVFPKAVLSVCFSKDMSREKSPMKDFTMLCVSFPAIGNNINQLAAKANTLGFVDAPQLKRKPSVGTSFRLMWSVLFKTR